MFDRKLYKVQSLQRLKGNWKINLLVSAVILVGSYIVNIPFADEYLDEIDSYYGFYLSFTIFISLLPLAISGIITIAVSYFSLQFFKNLQQVSFSTFVDGLNLWLKGILSTLWMALWIFLWSLLLLIPGSVKFYAYSQIYFILAENPSLSVRKAMEISKIITRGYKGNLFVQDLSFLGWFILCCLTGGLGVIFLNPYYLGAKVYAYSFLKEQALRTNVLNETDFSNN
ncbi:MAG: DUF975 family protein [Treponema sp.]|nr:DUF975 family protein [Treponema sp.]